MLTSTFFYILSAIFLAVALAGIIRLKKKLKPKQESGETLPSYVIKQEKVAYATMPKPVKEESHAYIEIQDEQGNWVEPPEPISFMASTKFRLTAIGFVLFGAVVYLYLAFPR